MPTDPDIRWDLSFEPEHVASAQPGWRAVFKLDDGNYFTAPVVCWATGWRVQAPMVKVTMSGGGTRWRESDDDKVERERASFGLIVEEGYLNCPEADKSFRGYAGPGEPLE